MLLAGLLLLQPLVSYAQRRSKVRTFLAWTSASTRVRSHVVWQWSQATRTEALTLWVPTVLIAQSTALSHPHLALIGAVFLLARVAYAVISLAGLPFLRTASWLFGLRFVGISRRARMGPRYKPRMISADLGRQALCTNPSARLCVRQNCRDLWVVNFAARGPALSDQFCSTDTGKNQKHHR